MSFAINVLSSKAIEGGGRGGEIFFFLLERLGGEGDSDRQPSFHTWLADGRRKKERFALPESSR